MRKNLTYIILSILFLILPFSVEGQTKGSFQDHGVAIKASSTVSTVCTSGANGADVILSWLIDHTGGYQIIMIDPLTGNTKEFPRPFSTNDAGSPFWTLLSSSNKYYAHYANYFIEFDPVTESYSMIKTLPEKTQHRIGISLTEDRNGLIWVGTYPNSGLISYNPRTKIFNDYGSLDPTPTQYPKYIATDIKGWVYIALGYTKAQIIAFNPYTLEKRYLISDALSAVGDYPVIYTDSKSGAVYGRINTSDRNKYKFYDGMMIKLFDNLPAESQYAKASGTQGLFHPIFPSGNMLLSFDSEDRTYTMRQLGIVEPKTFTFDYNTDGPVGLTLIKGNDNKIYGGSAFPMRFFSFNPSNPAEREDYKIVWQPNAMLAVGNNVYFGGYQRGTIGVFNPTKPYLFHPKAIGSNVNPLQLASAYPTIGRPSRMIASTDNNTIIMGGTPEYGAIGGGLLFWDITTSEATILKDSALILDQSAYSMAALDNNNILIGTTISPGTGAVSKAKQAVLYLLDITTKQIVWQDTPITGAKEFTDLFLDNTGLVYGVADRKVFFIFNPRTKTITYQRDISNVFGRTISSQSTKVFSQDKNGDIYMLFLNKIGKVNKATNAVELAADLPTKITCGGAWHEDKLFFMSESHLWSYSPTSTGVSYLKNTLSIYPNPCTDEFYIQGNSNYIGKTVIVYNLSGMEVHTQTIVSENEFVDVTNIPKGVYIVEIKGIGAQKMVKQ